MPDTAAETMPEPPAAPARGLPNAHYTDPDMHRAEQHALLAAQWAGLAVASDVPAPGDALPLTFCGEPLLLLRDRAGQVRVFYNVCRHRGMILVDAPRRIEGAIRCPYHSWCYATDGRLVTTPHVGGPGRNTHAQIDRATLGLIEVPSHVWRDVVFVNLSGTAPPFAEANADLIARWAALDQPLHHGGAESRFTLTVRCNWKLAVENYCESYHLPWVHPGLNEISRLEDHYNIEAPGAFSGQGTEVYQRPRRPDGTPAFPDFAGLPAMWDTGAEYVALYPNVLLGAHRDHAFAILLHPDGPTRTREHVHLYYAAPDTDPAARAANAAQWKTVFEEDVFVVEGMQSGRAARGFDGGTFSPVMDGPTRCFRAWAAAALSETSRAAE
ncbi:aromatic ring-hydroxylating dioxygenase subunit alpha [Dinoroseobacter sp. PD6]|uniref:aromatic ring-hydroxylating oxygenase subunit alpha n=1 Tax=Dinoroseobacter sp. PD6 TaxID=3028384 RepID=UPI00237A42B5|nr:aromatic ring-hydroxylating dioxygenase subunit alpha [Dinoroseobacter sp. PD6]MDD9715378.1 aromatic ring-hydroxylating dioxygenase subunit alpha [Dinoroseobacter sp. PD6]